MRIIRFFPHNGAKESKPILSRTKTIGHKKSGLVLKPLYIYFNQSILIKHQNDLDSSP